MNSYIALLRAINVGGYRKIKMESLRGMFDSAGFNDVTTYIQSGNVIFSSPESVPGTLAETIETEIKNTFGHDVDVIIRTQEHFKSLIRKNPFRDKDRSPFKFYVTFFKNQIQYELPSERNS